MAEFVSRILGDRKISVDFKEHQLIDTSMRNAAIVNSGVVLFFKIICPLGILCFTIQASYMGIRLVHQENMRLCENLTFSSKIGIHWNSQLTCLTSLLFFWEHFEKIIHNLYY